MSVTTWLDLLALALFAAGAAGALWPLVGAASLMAAGIVVFGGSVLADRVGGN